MLHHILIPLLITTTTLTAHAQETDAQPAPPTHRAETKVDWPQSTSSLPHTIVVVTLAAPGLRQKCKLTDRTADILVCDASHRHPSTTYKREDIAALVQPVAHNGRKNVLFLWAASGAQLSASFFVPTVASIYLRASAGFSFIGSAFVGDANDSNHDILLYQRPNTPLTLHLR